MVSFIVWLAQPMAQPHIKTRATLGLAVRFEAESNGTKRRRRVETTFILNLPHDESVGRARCAGRTAYTVHIMPKLACDAHA